RRARRRSIGNSDDREIIVYAEGLAARTSERPEVHLRAIVHPQMGNRGRSARRKNPDDDIAGVVDAERLTNGSSPWIEVGQCSGRVPLHSMEDAGSVERPASHLPVSIDRLCQAGVASEIVKGLHAGVRLPNESARDEEVVSESESDDGAVLVDGVRQG